MLKTVRRQGYEPLFAVYVLFGVSALSLYLLVVSVGVGFPTFAFGWFAPTMILVGMLGAAVLGVLSAWRATKCLLIRRERRGVGLNPATGQPSA